MSDMTNNKLSPGRLARNLDVCTAYGLNSGLCNTLDRMRARQDCPLWLVAALEDYIRKSNVLIGATRRCRDDLPKHLNEGGE